MAELTALHTLTAQMKREGIRRLLVLSGEEGWCFDHALKLRDALPGDWLWISPQPDAENHCSPSALQTLLGREFRHAVFDARHGFDAAAFAALSGTLKAGSWLVLLLLYGKSGKTNLMPTRCAGVIALILLRRRILSSISNAYLRRITTLSSGGKTSRSRWRILLPVLTGTRDRRTTTRTTATLTAVTDHAAGRGSGNGCAWAR